MLPRFTGNYLIILIPVCSGMMRFCANGLFWMKVHLSNLFGNNKISHTDRVKFSDDNIEKVMQSAADPMGGDMWWSTAEEPFQALSTCIGRYMLVITSHTIVVHPSRIAPCSELWLFLSSYHLHLTMSLFIARWKSPSLL